MKSTILSGIIEHKHKEIEERKSLVPEKLLEQSIFYKTPSVSLKEYLLREDKSGIIAEIKRKSPSAGVINPNISIERTSIGYMQAGASALSILTDEKFFGGNNEDLKEARKFNFCPILRKEFIVDKYQVIESKSIGADAILLIAAVLQEKELAKLAEFSQSLGLEVVVEVHTKDEIYDCLNLVDIVGVNNRNLKTFETTINTSLNLYDYLPEKVLKISESGIDNPEDVNLLRNRGYNGFLIGGSFMKDTRPEKACFRFIKELNQLSTS